MRNSIILIAVAVALAGAIAWRYYPSPPAPAARKGAPIVKVAVPELTGMARQGEIAFNRSCASCHGENAAGQDGVAPPLVHVIYEPNHHGDAAFHLAAKNGVRAHHWPFGDMAPVKGVSDQDLAAIVAYVRTLQRANGIN